jgi:tetratricopeptide (TPR) repeat protein
LCPAVFVTGRGVTIPPPDSGPSKQPDDSQDTAVLTTGFLRQIIDEEERVRAGFVNPHGITRIEETGGTQLSQTVVMVLTDRRVLFVTPNGEALDGGSLDYGELATVEFHHGRTPSLSLSSVEGVDWQFAIPDADSSTIEDVEKHLTWIGDLRRYLRRLEDEVETTAATIRDHVAAQEWTAAQETYTSKRDDLDRLFVAIEVTTPVANHVLAPGYTEMERTLEEAHVRLYIERARVELDRGLDAIDEGTYDRALTDLEQAQTYYERARDQRDVVARGDDFQFGTQRELAEDLESLAWELASAAGEPLHGANEAYRQAKAAEDAAQAREHWHDALELYTLFLSLDLGDSEASFADDADKVLAKRKEAANSLIEQYSNLARDTWNEGANRERAGETDTGLSKLETARDHLARAQDLAEEFNPVEAAEIQTQLEQMTETLANLRDADEQPTDSAPSHSAATDPSTTERPSQSDHDTDNSPEESGAPDTNSPANDEPSSTDEDSEVQVN